MRFLSPERLWLLVIPGLVAGAYVVLLVRHGRFAVRFTNLELLDRIVPTRAGWRRHLVGLLLVAALGSLVVGFARPVRDVLVARQLATVVLAVDTSLSMEAEDVDPNRLIAAQRAAAEFLAVVPETIRVGLVQFAGNAQALVAPTTDRQQLVNAVGRLDLREGTAVGEAIFLSLDLVAADLQGDTTVPAAIIVLSDGETTMGRPDAEAAAAAVDQGIPVTTVAFGTARGSVVVEGQTIPVPVNEGALREVAMETGGVFFSAETAGELTAVFDTLGSEVGYVREDREIADWFAALGLLLAGLAAAGSLRWFSRLG